MYFFGAMNKLIKHFERIAGRQERTIVGLMSGTSIDGLDIALCRIRGTGTGTQARVDAFRSTAYDDATLQLLRSIAFLDRISQTDLAIANDYLGRLYARYILEALAGWGIDPGDVDAIASHGQTVFHAPSRLHGRPAYPNATLQIVDGDHIALHTGILTVCDFRQKHVAAGGEGAPLAAYGDWLLFSEPGVNRIMLNIGGIANYTWLPGDTSLSGTASEQRAHASEMAPASTSTPNSSSAPFSLDTGPGNTLIDAVVRKYYPGREFDESGHIGASGTVHDALLRRLKTHPYFKKEPPKTCGPEDFDLPFVERSLEGFGGIAPADLVATLTALTSDTIAAAVRAWTSPGSRNQLFISGGGVHNRFLCNRLAEALPEYRVAPSSEMGLDPDSKEALIFAVLANETLCGGGIPFDEKNGELRKLALGKICLPW
jgi:anhydro-N-acetylmuramic acid kinase